MKYLHLVTFALLSFVAAEEDWTPILQNVEIHRSCFKESGLTDEQLARIRQMEDPSREKEVNDYILCSVKKNEVFTDEEGYNIARLLTLFNALHFDIKKAEQIVTKCVDRNEQKSSPAEWAYRGVKCMKDNNIEELFKEAQEKLKNNKEDEV